jgi:hypothetical protein
LIIAEAALSFITDFLGVGVGVDLKKPDGEFVEEIFSPFFTK